MIPPLFEPGLSRRQAVLNKPSRMMGKRDLIIYIQATRNLFKSICENS
jgi:hypothetical protein